MSDSLAALAARTLEAGTLEGLPDRHWIGGSWQASASGRTMESLDPGSGRAFARFAAGEAADVEAAVAAAEAGFAAWSATAPAERGRVLQRAAQLIRAEADRLAVAESLDCGKPVGEAAGDVRGAARAFEYYAGACDKLQGEQIPLGRDYLAFTTLEPVGVTAHVIPWNYPISTAARGLAPALAAGCSVVAKPAEQTPMTALMLAEILQRAGLPDGACNVVTGTGAAAGAPLVAQPAVRHVTFTGSVATGRTVMAAAARNIASVTLELGGKSPVVVLADCDREAALEGVLGAIWENAGQICSAGSRLVIERSLHDGFLEELVARTRRLSLGHGLRNPQVGPLNSPEQLAKVSGYVEAAKARGCSVATGGNATVDPQSGLGWFFEPTILDRLDPADPCVQEEIFGPVLAVQVAEDAEQALALANGTAFGLVAGIYTGNVDRALALARDLDAGQVYVNEYFAGGIETPFGGNRLSGFGREKGLEGLRAYCKVKSVTARIRAF
ncbi:aldehyde dehydrogenase (NAD+)/betaine-aldehyde dehydrogenase [Tistlia consotensis]|uniref:Aldehyde dehydrogenase (NAD+)/betaine-aldehyde dehydrogenase n=1 Tax=Tistlia consotensis USBA 355 TaxID=560819 RepID=A0A1Y6CWY6_9PROT|nr:aldehyde dehydrogenase family protein [Tistlia consotensis]SMF80804.1 aldehyde dehydrogenase (NAD+)/betaine-aldehyde dehydrogenase [Tistlia consotensis USBA 355]SNS21693.1 aldehyde dehydrogenase (NAD+)/betaine-aldehyde dehydrogenase [Tistlia consotensis]